MMFRVAAAASLLLILGGCAELRKHTYPAEFRYLEEKDLSNGMWKFAVAVANLNTLLSGAVPQDRVKQLEVVDQIKELENVAHTLGGSGKTTNHPMIDNHIELLLDDLTRARAAAEHNPPNYYLAGKISGSCQYCHGPSPYPHTKQPR